MSRSSLKIDWIKDKSLKAVSLIARGLWMEMLCLMDESVCRGYLVHSNKKPITTEQLSRIVGASIEEIEACLKELEECGVLSKTENEIIFSHQILKQEHKSQLCSEAGKRGGGNPILTTFKGHVKGDDIGRDIGEDKGIVQQERKEEKPPFFPPSLSPAPLSLPPIIPPKEEKREGPTRCEKTEKIPAKVITDEEWLDSIRKNPAYSHVDLNLELGKIDAWLSLEANRGKIKSRRRILNWINKIDRPLTSLNPSGSKQQRMPNLPKPPTDEEREASLQAMREAKKSLPWADLGGGNGTIEEDKPKPEKPPDERLVSAKGLSGLVHGLTGKMSMSEITTNSETTRFLR